MVIDIRVIMLQQSLLIVAIVINRAGMIAKFDEMRELVKLKTVGFDGRMVNSGEGGRMDIKTILQRNRDILQNKKLVQLKVIKARRLKIKVAQVMNFGKTQGRRHQRDVSGSSSEQKSSKMQKQTALSNLTKGSFNHGSSRSVNGVNNNWDKLRQSRIRQLSFRSDTNLQKGPMNLFQNFTDEQLGLIEQDPGYYLLKQSCIQLFHKFMYRKRLNKKDRSYETFMLKNKTRESKVGVFKNANSLKEIMAGLGYSDSVEKMEDKFQLLTNPITNETERMDLSVLPKSLMRSKKALLSQFQSRQAVNKQRLDRLSDKKKLDNRISMNYALGVAVQKKAMFADEKVRTIGQRNGADDRRSFHCRQRIKTLNEEVGNSILIVEQIRTELIRNRSRKRSMGL